MDMLENPRTLWPQKASFQMPAALQELLDSFVEFEPESCLLDLADSEEGADGHPPAPAPLVPLTRRPRSA